MKRTYSGDVANSFVRCLLSDVGASLGGLSKKDWEKTLEYFEYKCAYTGEPITLETAVMDHVIPHNREFCGLHIYGNVIPSTKGANGAKSSTDFEEFLLSDAECLNGSTQNERQRRIDKINSFMKEAGFQEKLEKVDNLKLFCHKEYANIQAMCEANKKYFQSVFKDTNCFTVNTEEFFINQETLNCEETENEEFTVEFEFGSPDCFKQELLKTQKAYISEYYADGRVQVIPWEATRFNEKSSLLSNIYSKPNYRKAARLKLGIVKLYVSITQPEETK